MSVNLEMYRKLACLDAIMALVHVYCRESAVVTGAKERSAEE